MAKLWIREYSRVPQIGVQRAGQATGYGEGSAMAQEPGTDQSTLTFSTSAQSAAFGTDTTFITIIADAAFHYVVGSNPTATTGALKVPADTLLTIGVIAGQKIAAIAAT